jgi:molybdopterin-guanine dinucleotide biosynthesis protein A
MGSEKGLVEFRNKPMASHILEVLNTLFSDVIVISNNDSYKNSGYQVFPDSIPDKGPAGGIVSAFEHANSEWIFVIACDMPLITTEAILKLYEAKNDSEICLPLTKDGIEPLCGFYHSSIHEKVRCTDTFSDILKMQLIVKKFNLNLVEFDNAENIFLNFNNKADLNAWKEYGA